MSEKDEVLDMVPAQVQPATRANVEKFPVDAEARSVRGYQGASVQRISDAQMAILTEQLPDNEHDILPTGEVYVSQVYYRRLLNKAFGPLGWALVPRAPHSVLDGTMMREYALFIEGRFAAEAVGQCDYQEKNERMTWADAAEGCKSNAIMRCCKDIGIASECWDRRFTERFQDEHCVRVWRPTNKGPRPFWRRKDARPWWDETGVVEGHGNDAPPAANGGEAPASASGLDKEVLAAADSVSILRNITPSEALVRASAFFGNEHPRKDDEMTFEERWDSKVPFQAKVMSITMATLGRTRSEKWKRGTLDRLNAVIKKGEGAKGEPAPKQQEKREPGAEG